MLTHLGQCCPRSGRARGGGSPSQALLILGPFTSTITRKETQHPKITTKARRASATLYCQHSVSDQKSLVLVDDPTARKEEQGQKLAGERPSGSERQRPGRKRWC